MKRLLMPAAALTTLKKAAFAFLCSSVLMVFGASAQTIQSIKTDPGANNGPPAGPILDLGGTYATPPTAALQIPGDGNETYQYYTVNFTANAANTTCTDGGCSTVITFAFRDDPAQISFTNASVFDLTADNGVNLLTNGSFLTGSLTPWTYVDTYGVVGAGFVSLSGPEYNCPNLNGVAFNCWIDGAVQAYDAISQTIATNPGDTYQISFYVAENSALIAGPGDPEIGPNYPGSACYLALAAAAAGGAPPAPCYFADLSNNGDYSDAGGNGINVAVYALPTVPVASQEETLTVTGAGVGSGTVADTSYSEFTCTITNGNAAETGCSANYPINTVVMLAASASEGSTFGGWGGACASSTTATCTVTMSMAQSVTAIFNQPGSPTQAGAASPGVQLNLNYAGGFSNNGYDANVLLAAGSPAQTVQVNEIVQLVGDPPSCNQLVQLNPAFKTAQCFVYSNPTTLMQYGTVMFEYTCPGSSTGGTCGSASLPDFAALLGTDFYFDATNDPGLYSGSPAVVIPLPLVGWLKGAGPDPLHPCTPNPDGVTPLFQSNQISSFTDPAKSPTGGNAKGGSGGTGSCWTLTYDTPGETPTVNVTQPVNGFTYQQNQATAANYACTTVNEGSGSAVGPYLTLASSGGCSATDSVGGSVAQGAQFDTATLGPHAFTATVLDSALNTVSQIVNYNVVAATNVTIKNVAANQTTPGSKLTYLIGVGDLGPANAVNVVVTDTLAPGTTFVSASGTNIGFPCTTVGGKTTCKVTSTPITCMGSALSSVVTCPVGTIMPVSLFDLNGAIIEVTVLVNQQGTKKNPTQLSNTATVTQSNAETKQDNTSTATTTVN
jgi:uncharacterized repeat protein (TIGR01451 family)